jgi:NAD(P)-dependent dehydrogenase (short-subunit alcohol dehydrogenase family)
MLGARGTITRNPRVFPTVLPTSPEVGVMNQEASKGHVVVTGVSSGIGRATAEKLIRSGFHVFGSVRGTADAEQLLKRFGHDFTPLVFNLSDVDAIQRAASRVSSRLDGRTLNGLVNNAGVAVPGPLMYQPLASFRRQFETNVFGQLAVTQAFAPLLGAGQKRLGEPGRIVMMSSVVGTFTWPFMGAYGASKHALEGMAESLRRELMLFGIDVILVAPGMVDSSFGETAAKEDQAAYLQTPFTEAMKRFACMMAKKKKLPAASIAEVVLTALTATHPKVRYTVVPNWFSDWFVPSHFPTRFLDRRLAHSLGYRQG